jgi:hypothetical protein
MQHNSKRLMAAMLLSGLAVSGCAKSSEFNNEPAENGGVAKIEHVKGVDQIVLAPQAARRLGIETGQITRQSIGGSSRLVIPYAAVLYDESGKTYTFTSPARLKYVQSPISVAYIKNGKAVLRSGPPAGTSVVTVGSAELIGTARGVEED